MYILSYLTQFLSIPQQPLFKLKSCIPEVSISSSSSRLPVLLWHGMGDSYNSSAMQHVESVLRSSYPDLTMHSIYVDYDNAKDQEASVFGDSSSQVLEVCEQVRNLTDSTFNAVGFSQGGVFLRAMIEMCGINVKNLVTFGSPHNGITDFPACDTWLCKKRNEILKRRIYDDNVQNNIIQAQYFRDVWNYDTYVEKSIFLKYINNEFMKDWDYFNNFVRLDKFAMIMFSQDKTVVPKESAWYMDTNPSTGVIIPFTVTEAFKYDLIGLKTLYEQNKIDFLEIDDLHMRISDDDLLYVAKNYL